jgi:hypothetical protein
MREVPVLTEKAALTVRVAAVVTQRSETSSLTGTENALRVDLSLHFHTSQFVTLVLD